MKSIFKGNLFVFLCVLIINSCSHIDVKTQQLSGKARTDFRSARLYLNEEMNDKALDLLLKIQENEPNHVETLWLIGNIYYDSTEDLLEIDEIVKGLKSAFEYYTLTVIAINKLPDWETYSDQNRKYTFYYIKTDSEQQLESIYLRIYEIADNFYEEDYDIAEVLFNDLLVMFPDRTLPAFRLKLKEVK